MTRLYLDTSAAGKLLVAEAESPALVERLNHEDAELVSAVLLETELRRLAMRRGIAQQAVTEVLEGVTLHELPAAVYRGAGLLPGTSLRSLDALHLAAALQLDVEAVLTYDTRMQDAATALGLRVVAPG